MEAILVHPENAEQLKTVKAILKALNVQFEPQSDSLPAHVSMSIKKSIHQYENAQAISLQEFKEKHFSKK
jgi:hypothetical protein